MQADAIEQGKSLPSCTPVPTDATEVDINDVDAAAAEGHKLSACRDVEDQGDSFVFNFKGKCKGRGVKVLIKKVK